MQIKHTFLFSFILGLAWTAYVFAYVTGPDPAMNATFGAGQTCNMSGCHTGNPINAAGGSVTISGLPTDTGWTPGQTYPLTVTIQRTSQRLFGFQLSAVADATTQQAGTLSAGAGVQVICGGSTLPTSTLRLSCGAPNVIQYAEHSDARVVRSTYNVNWTAPDSAATGTVRFNLAGNAANGDGNNTGDFIYTRVDLVPPAAAPPPPPPDLSTRAFTMVDRGGQSLITDGSGDLSVGYSRIQPASGSTTPAGVVIFGLRQNNTLITETGVPASVLLRSARIYAEVAGSVNTGVAIANPNDQPATINFFFTDQGMDFGGGSLMIPGNQQIAKFMDEAPFSVLAGRPSFQGTFTFTSDVDVSVIALRGFTNERTPSEVLLTTLPVTTLPDAGSTAGVSLAHFAEGVGWTTQIVLVNPSDAPISGTIQFFNQGSDAAPAGVIPITANGQTATSFNYSIPPRSSSKLGTSGISPSLLTGSVRVTPVTGSAPSSLVVFSSKSGGVTVSEAGVPSVQGGQGSAFRMYVEETSAAGDLGSVQTGVAIANLSDTAVTVNFELATLDGAPAAQPATISVPGNGQVAKFLHEFFQQGLTFPFKGILRISGGGAGGLAVVGLRGRYNERGDFLITTTPPTNESSPASPTELLFPHLVNGSGYTTQFILFSGTAGQAANGNLRFVKQDGSSLNLTLN